MFRQKAPILSLFATLVFFLAFGLAVSSSVAASPQQDTTPTPSPEESQEQTSQEAPMQLSISDSVCLSCHGNPGLTMPLEDGSDLDLYVPAEDYQNSIHGQSGYACVQCHTRVGNYPHPAFSAPDAREVTLQLNETCQRCHAYQAELAQDSVHADALKRGMRQAAVCTDCHSAHTVRRLTDPETHKLLPDARVWIPQTCERCHSAIYDKYKESVHGSALIGEGNPDVPTCIDCHGVHNIEDPTTLAFRLKSPSICAKCHTDPKVVGKYGISTNVLSTYVADFHGTTYLLFKAETPNAQFNTPVCYDCHGIHDIVRPSDPKNGLLIRANLLARCQECHPDADLNFPTAWMSHYTPSPDKYPLVYYVNQFYKFFIPGVIGGMAILVGLDFGRFSLNRYRGWQRRRPKPTPPEQEQVTAESQTTDLPDLSETPETETSDPENDQHG
jgi:hypothetical protein